jgi:hypothetical protein
VALYADHVEIVTKSGGAGAHERGPGLHVRPEHQAAKLAEVRGGRGRLYFQRQSQWELGRAAKAWITELVHHRRPRRCRADVAR